MAKKTFKDVKSLLKHLQGEANAVLKNDVAETVVKTMQEHIIEDVYDQYSPKRYERTGGLVRDIEVQSISDNTISVENVRSENGVNIAEIIESGEGYFYSSAKGYDTTDKDGRTYERPRPFTENTREELEKTDKLQIAMKKGLKKKGLKVE